MKLEKMLAVAKRVDEVVQMGVNTHDGNMLLELRVEGKSRVLEFDRAETIQLLKCAEVYVREMNRSQQYRKPTQSANHG